MNITTIPNTEIVLQIKSLDIFGIEFLCNSSYMRSNENSAKSYRKLCVKVTGDPPV